jgi:hypothetical protein
MRFAEGGPNPVKQPETYGAKGSPAPDNIPSARVILNDLWNFNRNDFLMGSVQSRYYFAEQVTCLQRKRAHQFVLAVW